MEEEDIWQEVVEELDERLAEGKDGEGMKDGIVALQTELEEDKNKTKHQVVILTIILFLLKSLICERNFIYVYIIIYKISFILTYET